MAIIKKYNPDLIYLSKKLQDRIVTIYNYEVTIVEAPSGYGKSTAFREYLKNNGKPYHWFNIDTDNKDRTFSDFCEKIKGINEAAAMMISSVGYPNDDTSCKKIVDAVNLIKYVKPTVFVIDNYQIVADKYLNSILKDLSGCLDKNTHIVVITQAINSVEAFELIMNRKINYISKNDFELSKEDIEQYYRLCGIKLEDKETDFLYKYTEGWISALYLQMLSYSKTNTFELSVNIENLIGKALWYNLDNAAQDFLIGMSVFTSFTFRQCVYMANGRISEEKISEILKTSGFIKYDSKDGKYYMHSILRFFLDAQFKKMEIIFRKKIFYNAAAWFRDNEQYADAIEFFYKIKDFESILAMDYDVNVLNDLHYKSTDNNLFIDITTNAGIELKEKYIKSYMLFVYFLFLDNERDYFKRECEIVHNIIDNKYKNSANYNELLGEYYILKCVGNYNKLEKMKVYLDKAYLLMKKQSKIINSNASLLFSCPSPISMYHSTAGSLDNEMADIEQIMPLYYKLTDGKNKGVEALCKAELLLNRGELVDAQKLCEKAIYMSDSRSQTSVKISALMCICRISYLNGDVDKFKKALESIENIDNDVVRFDIAVIRDMCLGFIAASINNIDKIPIWLTDNNKIEKNTCMTGLAFANVIFGKYLMLNNDYDRFLGISGQLLSVAEIYNNLLCKIYILIYMSVTKNQTGDKKKAMDLLSEAIELANPDSIYLPFIENFNMISGIFNEIVTSSANRVFITNVKNLSKKYTRGIQNVEKINSNDQKFGLTKREMEVAKLAAMRLSNKEIAEQLFIAESTVKSNLKVIFNKLGINSRTDLKNFL